MRFRASRNRDVFQNGFCSFSKSLFWGIFLWIQFGLAIHPIKATNIDSLKQALETLPDSKEKVDQLNTVGDHYMRADFEEAFSNFTQAIGIAEKIGYLDGLARAYNGITALYTEYGAYQVALEYSEKLLSTAEASGNEIRKANGYTNVGNIYMYLKDLDKAREMYLRALDSYERLENYSGIGIVTLNIGNLWDQENNTDSAMACVLKAKACFEKMESPNPYLQSAVHFNLGSLALKAEKFEDAILFFEKGQTLARAAGDSIQLARNYFNMARAYASLNQFNAAKISLEKGRTIAANQQAPNVNKEEYLSSAWVFERSGDFQNALIDYKHYHNLADSLAGLKTREAVARLELVAESDRKNAQIQMLENEGKQKNRLNVLLGAGLLVVAFITMLLIRQSKKQRKLNQLLQHANLEIKQQLEVREGLYRERDGLIHMVAHDLKAPINNTLSLISILDSPETTPENQKDLLEKVQKINQGAQKLISDLLDLKSLEDVQKTPEIQQMDLVHLIQQQIEQFRAKATQKRIGLTFEAPETPIFVRSNAGSVIRIFDNLLSNALKFSNSETNVHITVQSHSDQVQFSIADQGQGIRKEDFDKVFRKFTKLEARPTGGESSTGLGLSIVKALTDQIGGEITFQSEWNSGTTFTVTLPK